MLLQALCIISQPLVNSNWSYSLERSSWVRFGDFFFCLEIGHLIYAISSFVHHFVATGQFKLKLQFWNAQFGSKLVIFVSYDLEKQQGTSFMPLQALCIISEMPKLRQNFWPLWPWPLTVSFSMDVTSVDGNYSRQFHDEMMRGTLWKKVSQTDGQTHGLDRS